MNFTFSNLTISAGNAAQGGANNLENLTIPARSRKMWRWQWRAIDTKPKKDH
jgi:hypothetical protein